MRPLGVVRTFLSAQGGSVGVEAILWTALLAVPIASVADVGIYVVQDMQLRAAAQAGAQAVRMSCRSKDPPYSTNCTTMASAASAGVTTTQLGDRVTVDTNYPKEGYYCASRSSSTLTLVGSEGYPGSPPTKPSTFTCATVTAGSTALPGDYIRVKANHTYAPMFTSISIARLLPATMSQVAWIRMQ